MKKVKVIVFLIFLVLQIKNDIDNKNDIKIKKNVT